MLRRLLALIFIMMAFVAVPVVGFSAFNAEEDLLEQAAIAANELDVEKAIALYTRAIESGQLSRDRLAYAYAGRGEARETYTISYGIRDEEMAKALADYRKARDLMPEEARYHLSEAQSLVVLGGYEEAQSVYRTARRREEPYPHWTLIGLSRIDRIRGQYDSALQTLDELLRLSLDEGGTMPIHYHRGRTLYMKGDFAGAVRAFSAGIPKQPDYAYAYWFRACANARAGAVGAAVSDIEHALVIFNSTPMDDAWTKTPNAKSDYLDRARDIAVIKSMAAGRANAAEVATLCTVTWNDGEKLRTRSPLIPVDNSNIAGHPVTSHWRPVSAPQVKTICSTRSASKCI